jgi:pyridoxal phosphate enzyme (YggS family)
MAIMTQDALSRLNDVKRRISAALQDSGREQSSAHLIVVSKTFGEEDIIPLLQAGQRKFGENRVQESQAKWPGLMQKYPGVELHLIGPLQSNKAEEAVTLFDVIQSVDRPKIAEAIAKASKRQGRKIQCMVQVNIGSEPQKAGIEPKDADTFIRSCIDNQKLDIIGVMCIPPADEDPVPFFENLKEIANRNNLQEISMGMSGDYELALQHGATMVRVGSAIFGTRQSH